VARKNFKFVLITGKFNKKVDFKNIININMEIDVVCRICLMQNSLMENLFELKFKSDLIVTDKILEFCSIQASRKKIKNF
jgi:hypothetical protein